MSDAAATASKPAGIIEILDRADQDSVRDDLTTFFGPRAEVYLATYEKMRASTGRRRLASFTWSWPAFFITFVWMFYRKLYLLGAIMVILPVILAKIVGGATGGGGLAIYFGMASKGIYVRGALSRLQKADKLGLTGDERADYLRRAGGVSWPAGIISGLVFAAALALAIYGIVLAVHHS